MNTQPQTFAIVGASLAGAKAAETLRREGFDGKLVLIGEDPECPYERPPLTKDYLRDESPRERAYVHPESFYGEHDIELLTGTRASPARRRRSAAHARQRARTRLRPAAAVHRRRAARDLRPRRRPGRRALPAHARRLRCAACAARGGRRGGGDRRRVDRVRVRRLGADAGRRGDARRPGGGAARARARARDRRYVRRASSRPRGRLLPAAAWAASRARGLCAG